jgi:hypothetical protein
MLISISLTHYHVELQGLKNNGNSKSEAGVGRIPSGPQVREGEAKKRAAPW